MESIVTNKAAASPEISRQAYKEVYRAVITSDQIDALGHVGMPIYFHFIAEGMYNVMESLGLPRHEIGVQKRSFAVVTEESTWFQELLEGEEIYMATALERLGGKSAIFQHRIYRASDNALSFGMRFTVALMDLEKRCAMTIPDDYREALEKNYPAYEE